LFESAVDCGVPGLGQTPSFNAIATPSQWISESKARCKAPASFAAAAPGILKLTNDCGEIFPNNQTCHNASRAVSAPGIPFTLRPAITIAVGRRPYVSETVGEILVQTDLPTPMQQRGVTCDVTAQIESHPLQPSENNASSGWRVAAQETVSLRFDLKQLPHTVSGTLEVLFSCQDQGTLLVEVRKFRQFQRVAADRVAPGGAYTQIDGSMRAMRLGGKLQMGAGWYFSLSPTPSGYTVDEAISVINHQVQTPQC